MGHAHAPVRRGVVALAVGGTMLVVVACNGVLGIPEATRADSDAGDAAASSGGNVSCAATEKACNGACASRTDPAVGCGAATCAPCALPNATAQCAGGACILGQCKRGFEDCNEAPADGCEADVNSDRQNCGACGSSCDGALACVDGTCACTKDEDCGKSGTCADGVCTCRGTECDPEVACTGPDGHCGG